MNERFAEKLGLRAPDDRVPRSSWKEWCLNDRSPSSLGAHGKFAGLDDRFPAWLDIKAGQSSDEVQLVLLTGDQPIGLAGVSEGLSDEVALWLVPRTSMRWLLFSALARQRWEWSVTQPLVPCHDGSFEASIDVVVGHATRPRTWTVTRAPSDLNYSVVSPEAPAGTVALVGPRAMWTLVGDIVDLAETAKQSAEGRAVYQAGSA